MQPLNQLDDERASDCSTLSNSPLVSASRIMALLSSFMTKIYGSAKLADSTSLSVSESSSLIG